MTRYALYYTPPPDEPLWSFASAWLGRDIEGKTVGPRPELTGFDSDWLEESTALPRKYGFHATLKPPFRLADGMTADALLSRVDQVAPAWPAIHGSELKVTDLDGFLALTPVERCPAVDDLAAGCVTVFDEFRAPLTGAELAKRRKNGLSAKQEEMLTRWGYPAAMDLFRFHMTLTDRIPEAERSALAPALQAAFEEAAPDLEDRRLRITQLSVLTERAPGAPFLLERRIPLAGKSA